MRKAREMSTRTKLGLQLRELRKAVGMTQTDLAERAGLRQPSVCRMERGDVLPGLESIARYMKALDGSATLVVRVNTVAWKKESKINL